MAGPGTHKTDLYGVLGVPRDIEEQALKKAYRKLARRHHPDVNPGDSKAEERFKEISSAYAVLSDPERRRNYDEFGEISLEASFDPDDARRARSGFGTPFSAGREARFAAEDLSFGDLDDLFGRVFGGAAAPRGPRRFRGPDAEGEIQLEFVEAVRGCEKSIGLTAPGPDGLPQTTQLNVRIPPGIDDGGRIRLAGKGGAGIGGGEPGDLYLTVKLRPHPFFRREGRDLHVELPVTVREAVLGAEITLPTLANPVTLRVPPGSDSGRKLRLRGKGIEDPRTGVTGDLIATLKIRVPRELDDEAKAQLEALGKYDPPDIRKELGQ